jgi:hypothetical protein
VRPTWKLPTPPEHSGTPIPQKREAADRAAAELSARRAHDGQIEELITAEEWLSAQAEAQLAEDTHRQITDDADLADISLERAADEQALQPTPHRDAAHTAVPDIREVAATEPPQVGEDTVRVPTAEETASTITQAQRALAEIEQRRAQDERVAEEDARIEQLTRWHADDRHLEQATQQADTVDHAAPVLELSTLD